MFPSCFSPNNINACWAFLYSVTRVKGMGLSHVSRVWEFYWGWWMSNRNYVRWLCLLSTQPKWYVLCAWHKWNLGDCHADSYSHHSCEMQQHVCIRYYLLGSMLEWVTHVISHRYCFCIAPVSTCCDLVVKIYGPTAAPCWGAKELVCVVAWTTESGGYLGFQKGLLSIYHWSGMDEPLEISQWRNLFL